MMSIKHQFHYNGASKSNPSLVNDNSQRVLEVLTKIYSRGSRYDRKTERLIQQYTLSEIQNAIKILLTIDEKNT